MICDHIVETLREGDVLLTNDPWLVAGHLPDVAVVTPFFKRGRVVGFAGSIAHVTDIGGLLNQAVARTVYEEGVYFPPLKLYDAGNRNDALVSTIRASVRAPEMVLGDISAIVTANGVAAKQTVGLLDEYDLDDLEQLSDAVQARAEGAMRKTIAELPDGDHPYELTFDELDGPLTIGVVVRVRGEELVVDYVRVPPQHEHGGINSTLSFTTARTNNALNCLLTPHIPSNQGLFRPITVTAPEGTILNPRYPASVNDRTKVGWHTIPLVQGALASVVPDRVPAPSGFQGSLRLIGRNRADIPVSSMLLLGGGLGAGQETDGVDAICYPTSSHTMPAEIFEHTTGALIVQQELRPGSAGAGRTRGGHGVRTTVRPLPSTGPLTLAAGCQHQVYPPHGLAGGHDSQPARLYLDQTPVPVEDVPQRLGALPFEDPDVHVTLDTAGGGGYGDPAQREPALVLHDVRDGLLTSEQAAEVYGVDVDLDELRATSTTRRSVGGHDDA